MNYLSNSPFNFQISPEEIDLSEDKREKMVASLEGQKVILPLYEENLDRTGIEKICLLLSVTSLTDWYVLVNSERNLHLLAPLKFDNARVGVYVPTDQLIYNCIYFNRKFNFGFQIDLLRRLFVLDANPFALGDASAIVDPNHYLEMMATFTKTLFFIRNADIATEIQQQFYLRVSVND